MQYDLSDTLYRMAGLMYTESSVSSQQYAHTVHVAAVVTMERYTYVRPGQATAPNPWCMSNTAFHYM